MGGLRQIGAGTLVPAASFPRPGLPGGPLPFPGPRPASRPGGDGRARALAGGCCPYRRARPVGRINVAASPGDAAFPVPAAVGRWAKEKGWPSARATPFRVLRRLRS
ncbi:hypothetical protein FFZ77_02775 [Streptomyces katsurahamanus]|uniref:Uncharacterized protein n=1 Tax=Streptomyces katsurahamanus TaxID=2577098 RepID=A0ABW9NMT4_9ACTN|nr:hypothetical protein [Streptomyces katsurahamanus]